MQEPVLQHVVGGQHPDVEEVEEKEETPDSLFLTFSGSTVTLGSTAGEVEEERHRTSFSWSVRLRLNTGPTTVHGDREEERDDKDEGPKEVSRPETVSLFCKDSELERDGRRDPHDSDVVPRGSSLFGPPLRRS